MEVELLTLELDDVEVDVELLRLELNDNGIRKRDSYVWKFPHASYSSKIRVFTRRQGRHR